MKTKRFIFLSCLLFTAITMNAQDTVTVAEVRNLLLERSQMLDRYTNSLQKRSGVFGQRTKNDLRLSQEELQDIVVFDNRIMTRLQQLLEYKKIERQQSAYDAVDNENRIRNLLQINENLLRQQDELKEELKKSDTASAKYRLRFFIVSALLALILLWFFLFRIRRRRS